MAWPFTTGELVTAAHLNQISAAWTSYTPTWTATTTNPVIGNGTLSGAYWQVGKTVHFRIYLLAGGTTTYGSGNYRWALPVAPSTVPSFGALGQGTVIDTSAGSRNPRLALYAGSTTIMLADLTPTQVAHNVPFTFASGDEVWITGTYEAA